VYIGRTKEKKG